jgi:hypothetical protein
MMDVNDERVLLATRNITAMGEAMKHFEKVRQEDAQRVIALQGTVSQLVQQVQDLTLQVSLLRAKAQGHGGTT